MIKGSGGERCLSRRSHTNTFPEYRAEPGETTLFPPLCLSNDRMANFFYTEIGSSKKEDTAMRHITTLLRMGAVVALAGLAFLVLPRPAHAHARVSVGIGVPAPVVVAPPPPVVVVRPPLIAGGYYGYPHRHWRQRHWRHGSWGPRHYYHRWHRW